MNTQMCFENVSCGGARQTELPELQNVLAEFR
jgi:hypothetical protein